MAECDCKNILAIQYTTAAAGYLAGYASAKVSKSGVLSTIIGMEFPTVTDFKVGFLGVPPDHQKERIYSLSLRRTLQLFRGVGAAILNNPTYLKALENVKRTFAPLWEELDSLVITVTDRAAV